MLRERHHSVEAGNDFSDLLLKNHHHYRSRDRACREQWPFKKTPAMYEREVPLFKQEHVLEAIAYMI
jgi:hypothetical protein